VDDKGGLLMNDYDRIRRIADQLGDHQTHDSPELDKAFLYRVADALLDKEKACTLYEKTCELNIFIMNTLRDKLKKAGLMAVLLIVTGIYTHDTLSGRNRICFYESVYGTHALTIDAMNMCPLTWEFEV
jgi:hypothetical protein